MRGLDHRVAVEHVVAGRLEDDLVDAAAKLGQDGQAQVLVLHDHGLVALRGAGLGLAAR